MMLNDDSRTGLRCNHLCKSFGGVKALDDLDLAVRRSGIAAIVGPNGAGKTTLLNVLTGFVRADAGTALIDGHRISGLAPHRIARLGVARTFQDLRLVLNISVLGNVLLGRPNQKGEKLFYALTGFGVAAEEKRNREEAMNLLRFVGLDAKAHEQAADLSYGQQKLLTLAGCLATDARILLLDEPVAGVDLETIKRILDLMCRLREKGKLILFIEHNLAAVRQVADWVIVMAKGRVIAEGAQHEVLDRPEIIAAYVQ